MAKTIPEIYLDSNATTAVLPEVRQAMLSVLADGPRNPSSAHRLGDVARDLVATAREQVAALVGTQPDRILFTGTATEANNLVLLAHVSQQRSRCRIVTTQADHSSVLRCCDALEEQGHDIHRLPVNRTGLVDPGDLRRTLDAGAHLVAINWVNNETGVEQPLEEIASLCRERESPIHVDAAQAVGKRPVSFDQTPIDSLSFSGHKLHGPMGVGVLVMRDPLRLSPMIFGGPQERGRRAGTENVPAIVGLGVACEVRRRRMDSTLKRLALLRDRFETQLTTALPQIEINGDPVARVCNTTNLLFRGIDGQALVAQLDVHGIYCSQSSACTNMRPEPSYVLRAMGLSEEEAYSSVRFSFSELNTDDDVDRAVSVIAQICSKLGAPEAITTSSVREVVQ